MSLRILLVALWSMAFIGIAVPREVGEILEQIPVPGTKEPKDHYHITLLNLGSEIPIENVARSGLATFISCEKTAPFSIQVNKVESFPEGDDGFPIIARIDSPELRQLHRAMMSTFDRSGIEYSKKFPEFKPHVTLAYADVALRPLTIPPVQWMVSHVVVWGGDTGENRMIVKVPLEVPKVVTASRRVNTTSLRVATRWQMACQGQTCHCDQPCNCKV